MSHVCRFTSPQLPFQKTFNGAARHHERFVGDGDVQGLSADGVVAHDAVSEYGNIEIAAVCRAVEIAALALHGASCLGQHCLRIARERNGKITCHKNILAVKDWSHATPFVWQSGSQDYQLPPVL